jgi:hypothetical protein
LAREIAERARQRFDAIAVGVYGSVARDEAAATTAYSEALAIPDRMAGYDALCQMAVAGELEDAARVFAACEGFWTGVAAWALARGLGIESPTHVV